MTMRFARLMRASPKTSGAPAIESLDAMLVCQQISGGLELVLGLNRDPEMGLVVMAGSAACCLS